jgi:transcriptional regulator with XRE-family HTH domain
LSVNTLYTSGMKKDALDPVMKRVVQLFERSGKTLEELGRAMGADPATARQSAWQFISKTADPRISMLRRFAKAMDVPLEELVGEKRKGSA